MSSRAQIPSRLFPEHAIATREEELHAWEVECRRYPFRQCHVGATGRGPDAGHRSIACRPQAGGHGGLPGSAGHRRADLHLRQEQRGAWAWNFKGPEAELFDTQKKSIGKHYGGPTWEGADGGKVVAAMKANAPAPGGNTIPWLLLDIKSSEGSGQFSQAKGILRVSTTGGTAPAQGCDEAHANQESRVPYTATYLFLK